MGPTPPIRVLLVEDDEDDYVLARDRLVEGGPNRFALDWVADPDEALAVVSREAHDVVLLDYRLGGRNGLDLLREAIAGGVTTPMILLTGQGDREIDFEAMEAGAADYLVKTRIDGDLLERSIRYAIERKRTEDSLRRARSELEERVRERTAELALANEELTLRIEESDRAKELAETASRAKDQFLAMLSHELRTPLTPVLLAVSDLLGRPDLTGDLREMIEIIRRHVELEVTLIDDLLDVMRIIRGKLVFDRRWADARELIEQTVEICRGDLKPGLHSLVVDLRAADHGVVADSARFKQVLWNLIKNAIKFSPRGGEIAVRSRNEGADLVIEVSDQGLGIDPEALPRIFNAFEQGESTFAPRVGGLGLGLAICRSVVEAHSASLTARSPGRGLGLGSTFTLRIATSPKSAGHRPESSPGLSPHRGGENREVLLVEDDPMTSRIMAKLLRESGFAVTTADGVAPALDALSSDRFDLLISDLGLPDGSGLDLMRQARVIRPTLAIALTGYGMEDDVRNCYEAGFAAHLTKPINFENLLTTIQGLQESGLAAK